MPAMSRDDGDASTRDDERSTGTGQVMQEPCWWWGGLWDWVGGPEMMRIDDGAHMKTGKRDNKMGSNGLGGSLDIRIIGDVAIPVHWDYCGM